MTHRCVTCGHDYARLADNGPCPECGEPDDIEELSECLGCREDYEQEDMTDAGFCKGCAAGVLERFYVLFDADERALILEAIDGEYIAV